MVVTGGTRVGGGTIPAMVLEGCDVMLCAGDKIVWVVWAAETTETVCIGTLWTFVVENNLRTAPPVGVSGVVIFPVVALVTTPVTFACDVAITLLAMCLRSAAANTE